MKVRYGHIDAGHIHALYEHGRRENYPRIWAPLSKSVQEKGIVNPVLCNQSKGTLKCTYGVSRAQAAHVYGLPLPALIADYEDAWPDLEWLRTLEEIYSKFGDPEHAARLLAFTPGKKLWMVHHERIAIDSEGHTF